MIALTEGASGTETAHRCGWASASAFIGTFTRAMGRTPGAYRTPPPDARPAEPA
jgi:AraC-like DNA-binding protein